MTQTVPPQDPTRAAARPELPLPRRPRRELVRREPSPRAAARQLRRTAPRTTSRTWTRRGLPGAAAALGLEGDGERVLDRYLPSAA
jgi:hypothetical protein